MIRLADSLIIPFDLTAMTNYVSAQVAATVNEYGTLLPQDKLGKLGFLPTSFHPVGRYLATLIRLQQRAFMTCISRRPT